MKIRCEICGIEGQLQHLSKNYYRVKHYLGSVDGRLEFDYHKQSIQYMINVQSKANIDPIDQRIIDPKLNKNSCFLENVAPPIGLGPMTDWLTASRST